MHRATHGAGDVPARITKRRRDGRGPCWRAVLLGGAALMPAMLPGSWALAQSLIGSGTGAGVTSGTAGNAPGGLGVASPGSATGMPPAGGDLSIPAIPAPPQSGADTAPTPAPAPAARNDRDAPVTFTANEVEYQQDNNLVIARGAVEAWQNERILRADTFTYNRETGIATAEGNVQLLEPDGQVTFADRAELTGDMRDGVVEGLRARLAQNGKLAATGARRTDGNIVDMSRVVYSSCDLCADDPTAPPLWQVRARIATHDRAEQILRYRDATLDFGGWPVFYTPYLSHPDPSVPRQSGFLAPALGNSTFLGPFIQVPYYWAIDGSQDMILRPTFSVDQDPGLGIDYRRRFNSGTINFSGSVGNLQGGNITDEDEGWGGHIYSSGQFALDEHWRTGFNLNRASSQAYLRAWRYSAPRVLTSDVYLEGFWGAQGFARIDARAYQGLNEVDRGPLTPLVLPNAFAEYAYPRDSLGGYLTVDAGALVIFRDEGTDSRRLTSRTTYTLPKRDRWGSIWTLRGQADLYGISADGMDLAPNFFDERSITAGRGNVRVALDWRMPFIRSAGEYGSQILEPRVQLVTGPSTGRQLDIPNEDSIDFEFTDANLFALNRFPGRDREEGGSRVDAALRGVWLFPNGGQAEALVGRSFRASTEDVFYQGSGVEDRASDWVGRLRLSPVPWLDLLARTRLDGKNLSRRLTETSARVSLGPVSVSAGYLFTDPNPALTLSPRTDRNEVSGGVSARLGTYWQAGVYGRYDIQQDRPVSAGINLTYEDECLVFTTSYHRDWAQQENINNYYPSGETLLFRIGFKTIGDFGLRAI
ncbi:LPS-assembly protein LptD [Roseomonas sp. 1311]|uniref:LPS-assembly protein LptD n=2 Tax=Roseomonas marmotae TaxID=2768161 RepID=A0ABS3KHL6_9PROT|nr:LPS-assembly protein LptD [Roseomonas marmotae]